MVRFLTILSLLFLFIQTGCIAPSKIKVTLNSRSSAVSKAAATLSSVSIVNNQIVLSGANLNGVTQVRVSGPSVNETLSIESKSTTDLIANGTVNIAFLLGGVFDLIISDARGAATYQVTFTLPNGSVTASKLDSMGANPAEVLTWTGSYWAPQPITGGLAYQGTFDPNTDGLPLGGAGEYYVASDTGTYDFGAGNVAVTAGEMIIHNGSDWEIVANGGAIPSIGLIGDVDTTGAVNGSVLKYDGSNWIVGVDNNSGSGSGNWATSGSDSYLSSGVVAVGAAVDANTRLRLGSSYDSITGAFSGVDANSSGVTMVTSGTNGKFLDFTSDTGAFTGDVLFANMANGSGTFSGNFIQLQKNGVSQFSVSNTGMVTTNYLNVGDGASNMPSLSFLNSPTTGIWFTAPGTMKFSLQGVHRINIDMSYLYGQVGRTPALYFAGGGTNTSPTYSFAGDYDTGMLAPAADTLAFSTAGSERVRINSSGNVGIGTTTPGTALHVAGGFRSEFNAVSAYTTSSGGASTPATNIYLPNGWSFDNNTSFVNFLVRNADSNNQFAYIGPVSKSGAGVYSPAIVFGTSDSSSSYSEKMRIDSTGYLGIGTSAPTAKLDIAGSIRIADGTEADGYVLTTDSYGYASWQAAGGSSQWITNASDIYYSTGNVGIGGNPSYPLHVQSAVGTMAVIERSGAGGDAYVQVKTNNSASRAGYLLYGRGSANAWIMQTGVGGNSSDLLIHSGYNVNSSPVRAVFKGTGGMGIGPTQPANFFEVGPIQYSTGTASQSGTTITGVGTTWTSSMVGSQFIFEFGQPAGTITSVSSTTSLEVTTNQTISSRIYAIHYPAINVADNGNVGIGVMSPTAQLHVDGNFRLVDGTEGVGKVLTSDTNGYASWQTALSGGGWLASGSNSYNSTGFVGIGTTSPSAPLHVAYNTISTNYGALSVGAGAYDGSTAGYFTGSSNGTVLAVNSDTTFTGNLLDIQKGGIPRIRVNSFGGIESLSGPQGGITLYSGTAQYKGLRLYSQPGGSSGGVIQFADGEVGANWDTRLYRDSLSSLTIDDNAGGAAKLTVTGSTYLSTASTGRVGVGTSSPDKKLHVFTTYPETTVSRFQSNCAGCRVDLEVYNSATQLASESTLVLVGNWGSGPQAYARIAGIKKTTLGGDLTLGTADTSSNMQERLRITTTGYVGIGTNDPKSKLDISGQLRINDGTQANGYVLTSDTNGYASWAAPTATNITSSTTGYISSTNVNSAIAELEAEKLSLSGGTTSIGDFLFSGASTLRTDQTPVMLTDVTNVQYVQDALSDLWVTSGSDVYRSSGNVGFGVNVPTSRIHANTSLSAATGDEVAYQLDYTTNKATSGNDTGLLINMTDTNSPGASNAIEVKRNGTTNFSLSTAGILRSTNIYAEGGNFQNYTSSIGTAAVDAFAGWQTVAATVGVPVQYSPRIRLQSRAWDTDGLTSVNYNGTMDVISYSDTTTYSLMRFGTDQGTGTYTYPLTINSDGQVKATSTIGSSGITTGALVVGGGLGVGGNIYSGSIVSGQFLQAMGARLDPYASSSGAVASPQQDSTNLLVYNTTAADNNPAYVELKVRNANSNYQNAYIGSVSSSGAGVNTPTIVIGQQTGVNSYQERLRIDTNGYLGVGTTNPGYLLQVGDPADGSEARANVWNTLSDERLKENFVLIPHSLERLLSLKGYNYQWNRGSDRSSKIGFKAQEVEAIFPEVVSRGKDGFLSLSYANLVAPIVEAIKELHTMIVELFTKMAAQDRAMASLKEENEMLKTYICEKDPAANFCIEQGRNSPSR